MHGRRVRAMRGLLATRCDVSPSSPGRPPSVHARAHGNAARSAVRLSESLERLASARRPPPGWPREFASRTRACACPTPLIRRCRRTSGPLGGTFRLPPRGVLQWGGLPAGDTTSASARAYARVRTETPLVSHYAPQGGSALGVPAEEHEAALTTRGQPTRACHSLVEPFVARARPLGASLRR
jgi:hypothetical protein